MPKDRYFEKYQYGIGQSKDHVDAMNYIYGTEDSVESQAEAEDEDLFTQCKRCQEYVNLWEEPIFVMGIYADDQKRREEFWCKKCLKKGA
jgi:hypothetical protein